MSVPYIIFVLSVRPVYILNNDACCCTRPLKTFRIHTGTYTPCETSWVILIINEHLLLPPILDDWDLLIFPRTLCVINHRVERWARWKTSVDYNIICRTVVDQIEICYAISKTRVRHDVVRIVHLCLVVYCIKTSDVSLANLQGTILPVR